MCYLLYNLSTNKIIADGVTLMPKISHAPATLKKVLANIKNIVIDDHIDHTGQTGAVENGAAENNEYLQENYGEHVQFTKLAVNRNNLNNPESINKSKKYSLKKKSVKTPEQDFAETFDAIRKEKAAAPQFSARRKIAGQETKTAVSVNAAAGRSLSGSPSSEAEGRALNLAGAAKRLSAFLFAALCGSVMMPFGMNPLGIALICAADKHIFYIYSGLLISIIFIPADPVIFFGLYTVAAGVKIYLKYIKDNAKTQMLAASPSYKYLDKKDRFKLQRLVHFNNAGSVVTAVLMSAAAGSIVGFLTLALNINSLVYGDIVTVLLFCLTVMLFTYLYSGLFEVGADDRLLEKAGFCAVIFTVVYAVAPYYIFTLSIGFMLSLIFTLTAANSSGKINRENEPATEPDSINQVSADEEIISRFSAGMINKDGALSDMTRGALTGLLCGIALGDTAGAVILGLCGIVTGLFFAQSRALAIIAGLVASVSYSVYLTGTDALARYIPNIIISFALYLPASAAYAGMIAKRIPGAVPVPNNSPVLDRGLLVAELPASKLSTMSEAFRSLSVIFSEFAERIKMPTLSEIKIMAEASFDKACGECEINGTCRLAGMDKSNAAKKCADYIRRNKRLEKAGIPRVYSEECEKINEIKARINELYCGRLEEKTAGNKTDAFASGFDTIAKLLQNNIKAGKEDIAFKKDISADIYNNLEAMGIECDNAMVIGERRKIIYIFGIRMINYAGTIQDITDMFEQACGTRFGEPEYILRGDYIIMKSQSRNKFRIYSAQASKSAGEVKSNAGSDDGRRHVNGDSVSVFEGSDGFCYGLISDGMGSGRNAALSSRLTALVMEKLLSAGNQKDLTLEMLNSLLLAKNDECFASVDLFEADLITGAASFIKAGAAPSFIIRNGRLFKIQSSTVPAGIISGINSEQTKFELENGDYILMLSDGIISTFEEGAWLFEMLESDANLNDPENLLNNILSEASRKNKRKDDMSVLFMRVAGA